MRHSQEELIEKSILYFKRGDFSLGYRTLLDTALNTDSENIFSKVLEFVAYYENEPNEDKSSLLPLFEKYAAEIKRVQIEPNTPLSKVILKAERVTKNYNKGRFVLGPVDVELKKGDIFGLVGENGNGKTTLLTILASLIKPTSGSLTFSFSTQNKDQYDLLSKLVYIPQRTAVWHGKVLDNLKFTLAHHGVKGAKNDLLVLMMVARFGLWKYKDLKWKELSSGYKMRFELARTMLRKPEIILLDEPLANLDVLAQQIILEDLKMLCKSPINPIAMVFSSQQLYEVEKVSDKVIYLRNGLSSSHFNEEEKYLIIELDTENSREDINEVFSHLPLEKLVFNGGVYILYFKENITFSEVVIAVGNKQLKVESIRDISKSTRRFFVY